MQNYTFSELLTVFVHLQSSSFTKKTQAGLAEEAKISRRTLAGWLAGDYVPRSADSIDRLATALCLTSLQTDLLLYAVNPAWVKYGTPRHILETSEVVRYREDDIGVVNETQLTPVTPTEIERSWILVLKEEFGANSHRWGVGVKNNNMCQVERMMKDHRYTLSLQNLYHEDVFVGGDSSFIAPDSYYLSVNGKLIQGITDSDGYGLMFEAIGDECYAFFRIRDHMRRASVVRTLNGGDRSVDYLYQLPIPSLFSRQTNQLGILAIDDMHWFYINGVNVGNCRIPRLPCARLDVGIAAGSNQQVVCEYTDFRIYTPPHIRPYMKLETLVGLPMDALV